MHKTARSRVFYVPHRGSENEQKIWNFFSYRPPAFHFHKLMNAGWKLWESRKEKFLKKEPADEKKSNFCIFLFCFEIFVFPSAHISEVIKYFHTRRVYVGSPFLFSLYPTLPQSWIKVTIIVLSDCVSPKLLLLNSNPILRIVYLN